MRNASTIKGHADLVQSLIVPHLFVGHDEQVGCGKVGSHTLQAANVDGQLLRDLIGLRQALPAADKDAVLDLAVLHEDGWKGQGVIEVGHAQLIISHRHLETHKSLSGIQNPSTGADSTECQ